MQQVFRFFQNTYFQYLLLLIIIYFIAFFKLGNFAFRLWDESMFAVNAYEMAENGNYMVPYFDHAVDWRNSKPLLLTWIQAGIINVFGFSELTMRLPSAIAVTVSILMLFAFLKKYVNVIFAWIASLILLTSPGYITFHTGRTADADALLSLFLLGMILYWARWLLSNQQSKNLFIAMLFFALALLTKSFAAMPFIIPMALLTFFYLKKNIVRSLFQSTGFYAGLLIVSGALIIIFYVRELFQPGYLDYTFGNDAGRLGKVIEGHSHGWDFYLESVFYNRFAFWSISFMLSVLVWFNMKKSTGKDLLSMAYLITGVYFLLLSLSVTKLIWYDMPVYPLMAAASALPVYMLVQWISHKRSHLFTAFTLLVLFFIPYRKAFFLSQGNAFSPGDRIEEFPSIFLHSHIKEEEGICDMAVYHHGYHGSILCYKYMYADRGKKLRITNKADFVSGEKVFVSNDSLKQVLVSNYRFDTLETNGPGILVQIK